MARTYNQDCILAHALDLLGERWTLLIVRELFLGPRRFADLLAGLPGIGTNLLSKRLKELERLDIVAADPAPANRNQYRLSDTGEALRPTIRSLMLWSITYHYNHPGTDAVDKCIQSNDLNPDSVALAFEIFAIKASAGQTDYVAHIEIEDQLYTFYHLNNELIVRRGQDAPAVCQVSISVPLAMRAFRGEISKEDLIAGATTSGREDALDHIFQLMTWKMNKDASLPEKIPA